ncbi:MAG: type II toxin-antitoxin system Phd/YefM family antitoxin [Balneolales bacterium]
MKKNRKWPLQDAKNKFSELVNKAEYEGPQYVTKRGHESVVVVSFEDYKKLKSKKNDLLDFFKSSPLRGADLDLKRDRSSDREIQI